MNLRERFVYKITSARFIVTLFIIGTYCWVVIKALDLFSVAKISKDFFFGLFAGFSAIAGSVITFYFTRHKKEKDKNNK